MLGRGVALRQKMSGATFCIEELYSPYFPPEKKLYLNMIEQAYSDLRRKPFHNDAVQWILNIAPKMKGEYVTFSEACENIGLDPDYLRECILEQLCSNRVNRYRRMRTTRNKINAA